MVAPAQRKTAGRRLSDRDVRTIVAVIEGLDPRTRPTWQHVESAALTATRHRFTRQALSKHDDVVAAYEAKLKQYREGGRTGRLPKTPAEDDWDRERGEMQAEIDRLRARIAALDEAHVLHVANAIRLGIAQRELERPTEKLPKGATDKAMRPRLVKGGAA